MAESLTPPPSPHLVGSEPTEKMLAAGSLVAWDKYANKEDAARDVWKVMLRNSPNAVVTEGNIE